MNTTARIESTGEKNKIHISEETARRLISFGKEHWVQLREDTIVAKGKGSLKTYWLNHGSTGKGSIAMGSERDEGSSDVGGADTDKSKSTRRPNSTKRSEALDRIVQWNVDLLHRQLKIIIAHRESRRTQPEGAEEIRSLEKALSNAQTGPLEEVQDVITLPKYDAKVVLVDSGTVQADEVVLSQLRNYVKTIAGMYRDNPFHNYEHARYVFK